MDGGGSEEARGSISKGSVLTMLKYVPAALNLAFILEGNDLIWNAQGFPPQIQRAGLTTVYSRVHISLNTAFSKILMKPFIVQK